MPLSHYLVQLHGVREGWPENMTAAEEQIMSDHYYYLVRLMNEGKVLLAGPCLDPIYGLIVLEVDDESEAKRLMDEEPSVVGGVHTYTLHPFRASILANRYQRPTGTGRSIDLETVIPAPIDSVWQAWTTSDGFKSFLVADARVELRVGGPFELYFAEDSPPGLRGSEGCHILSYIPGRLLSFEWNAPPSIPNLRNANMRNWVVVFFEAVSPVETRLKLHHLGWGEGEDWDACFAYFAKAWPFVLEACRKRFAGDE
jgi:uncharacterized protein YndB with AHSA1/START domain/uncharacterized protein YciI